MQQSCISIKSTVVLISMVLSLSACSSYTLVAQDGTTDEPKWPQAQESTFNRHLGTFPDPSSLAQVKAGVTKDQLYYLLGRPHYGEGFVGVREWNYLFHFHTSGQGTSNVTTCQLKVLFDKDKVAQSIYWHAIDPQNGVCVPAAIPLPQTSVRPQRYTLSADALFAFNKSGLYDLNPKGKQELDKLSMKLQNLEELNTVIVVGHTDYLGSDVYNLSLSQQRANTIKSYLIGKGIPPAKIMAIGMGKQQPVKQCTEKLNRVQLIECLQPNRRVELEVNDYSLIN